MEITQGIKASFNSVTSSIPAVCTRASDQRREKECRPLLPKRSSPTAKWRESEIILRTCVHCGFCTATCPTFLLLGDELDSPRGRIYLIKDMLENNRPARRNRETYRPLSFLPLLHDDLSFGRQLYASCRSGEKLYREDLSAAVCGPLVPGSLAPFSLIQTVSALRLLSASLARPFASFLSLWPARRTVRRSFRDSARCSHLAPPRCRSRESLPRGYPATAESAGAWRFSAAARSKSCGRD